MRMRSLECELHGSLGHFKTLLLLLQTMHQLQDHLSCNLPLPPVRDVHPLPLHLPVAVMTTGLHASADVDQKNRLLM